MLLLVNMLVEYCQCVDDTPMLVTDIMNKLFETLKVRVIYFIPLNEKKNSCHKTAVSSTPLFGSLAHKKTQNADAL